MTEIYLNEAGIGNNEVDDIMRIITNSDIQNLYLLKNKIVNYNELLKILYRTKIIKDEKEFSNKNINNNEYFLTNLNLSNNAPITISKYHTKLIPNLINQTNLNPISISHILYGPNPHINVLEKYNINESVEIVEIPLKNEKKEDIKKIEIIQVDINRLKEKKVEKIINIPDEIIMEIIGNPKAKYTVYLKDEARKLINDNENNNSIDKKEIKIIENKLVDYMKLKRLEKEKEQLKKIIKSKKLIII